MRQRTALELKNARVFVWAVCEAAYVVAHAKCRKQRGRRPSLTYDGERNPLKALAKAKVYLRSLGDGCSGCGINIEFAIEQAIKVAGAMGEPIEITFNDIVLAISPDSDVDENVADFYLACEESKRKYLESPEGQAYMKACQEDIENRKSKVNEFMEMLNTLDFDSLDTVLLWLDHLLKYSDDTEVELDWEKILEIFGQHGFRPNDWLHPDKGNLDQCGRYIIGQALACLECPVHAIMPVIHCFVEEWFGKYEASIL